MNVKVIFVIILSILLAANIFAQRRPEGPPPGEGHHDGGWTKGIDTNQNGIIEADEFQAAIDRTFADLDKNQDGVIDRSEIPDHHRPMGPPEGMRPGMPDRKSTRLNSSHVSES